MSMGILQGIFKARDKPTDRAVSSNYTFLMGSTTAGKTVTERSALQMTAVYSCVRILAEAVAGLPLHLYRYTDDGGKEKAIDHSLYKLLHDEPNPEMSSFVFRETMMTHLLLWGNCYAQIIRNGKGEVVALYPLMPNRMSVHRDESGQLYYLYTRGADDVNSTKGMTVKLVLLQKYFSFIITHLVI
jgi:HK97 family phage portal protein